MKILVLGGTQFVGRHLVEAALAAGHTVSTFNRGVTPDALSAAVERLHGNRDDGPNGLSALKGRTWDACVDVSGYTPRQVRASTQALREQVAHYAYVSAVSVYGDPQAGPVFESQALLPPAADTIEDVNGETYGPLKVACEQIVQTVYPNRCTILRPQIIVGKYDESGRFEYWIRRALRSSAQATHMLAPGDGSDFLQVIDVRDVSAFIINAITAKTTGCFNLAGHRTTWAAFMQMLNAKNIVWVNANILQEAKLTFSELPLYRAEGAARSSLMHVNCDTAQAAGLTLTPMVDTIRALAEALVDKEGALVNNAEALISGNVALALTREREAQLIATQYADGIKICG